MCPGRSSPWARQSQMYHNRKNILGRLGNYVALIRAPGCKTSIDGSRSQRAQIRAPDRNNVPGLSQTSSAYLKGIWSFPCNATGSEITI